MFTMASSNNENWLKKFIYYVYYKVLDLDSQCSQVTICLFVHKIRMGTQGVEANGLSF